MTRSRVQYRLLECRVDVEFDSAETGRLLDVAYGRPVIEEAAAEVAVVLARGGDGPAEERLDDRRWVLRGATAGELVIALEAWLTVELQRLRPDLWFVHAAVVARANRAVVIAGASGSGKSTLCWALLRSGWSYGSDELAPIDPERHVVHPYPRALVLKRDPPAGFGLPEGVVRSAGVIHVEPSFAPAGVADQPLPLAAVVVLVAGRGGAGDLESVSAARGGALLYRHALNPLAHEGEGLDAAIGIARSAPCFAMSARDLGRRRDLVELAAGGVVDGASIAPRT